MVQLTEPLEMFNAYVVDFTSSVGYGAESSTMQMTLVEDPDNVDSNGNPSPKTIQHKEPRLDEDGKMIPDGQGSVEFDTVAGFPEVGTCCQFRFGGFEFVGIFQRYNYNQSLGGNTYDITFESPSKALDGVQVILDKFEGTVFTEGNRYLPSEGANFTSQINNIYNPFGIKENYAFGGLFGGSGRNEFGFDAKELLTLIEEISRSEHTLDIGNQDPSPDASTNSDDEEIIGGPIHFGESKFTIDFGELKGLIPSFLRIKGDFQSINAILQECTDIIVHDYVTFIKPTTTRVQIGSGGGIVPTPIFEEKVLNGVTLPTLDDDENVTGPVISFSYLNKTSQPNPGVIETLVNDKKSTTLISATNGKELADVTTQKLMIGDKATRVWHAGMQYMIPVYGKDLNGEWLLGAGFSDTDIAPVLLPNGAVYNAHIAELKAACSGFDTWSWYHVVGSAYGYTNVTNPVFSSFARMSQSKFNKLIQNVMTPYAMISSFNGDHLRSMAQKDALNHLQGNSNTSNEMFTAVLNTAKNYYGKTYFVMLPVEPGGIDNNIRFVKEKSESAWAISDSGWDPDFTIKDIDGYDDEGRLKACAGYIRSRTTSNGVFTRDFGNAGRTLPYVIPGFGTTLVGTTEVTIDNKIYWRQNPYFQQNNNPYDDVSAMVHVTVPGVYEFVNGGLNRETGPQAEDRELTTGPRAAMDGIFGFFAGLGAPVGMAGGYSGGLDGVSSFGSMENAALSLKYMGSAVRPFEISIPQNSSRYTWGPWYRYSSKRGKAEIEQNSQLRPEVFGSVDVLDEAAFALVGSAVADMYQSESGTVELAEFPEYNIAERFTGSGPYVTKISCKVGTGGITTNYEFSTWTRNFGKIAKYNVDRIAAINKNKIQALKQRSSNIPTSPLSGGGGGGGSAGGGGVQEAGALKPKVNNFFTGLPVPMAAAGGAANNPDGAQVWLMSGKNGESVGEDLIRKVQFGNNSVHAYDITFGCSQEQILSPIGVVSTVQRVETGQHYEGMRSYLPYIKDPKEADDSTGTKFSFNLVNPSAADLDPYFGPKSYDGWGKVDYGVTIVDDFATVSQGGNHMAFEDKNNTSQKSKEYRTYGLRGPILLSGWGYDVDGIPVPRGERDLPDQFNGSFSQNRSGWKTGPVDLRWDEDRQVWAGGYQIVEGFLTTEVKPANGQNPDGESTVQIYKDTGGGLQATGEEIKVKNLDKHLEIKENLPLYASCIRINGNWRFLYIGCDVPPVEE